VLICPTINVTFKKEKQINTSLFLVYYSQIWSMFIFLASVHADQGQVSNVEGGYLWADCYLQWCETIRSIIITKKVLEHKL